MDRGVPSVYLIISTVFWCSQLNNVFNNRSSELTEEGGGQEGWGSGSGCPECVSDNQHSILV